MFLKRQMKFGLVALVFSIVTASCNSDGPEVEPEAPVVTPPAAAPEVLTVSDIHFSPYHDRAVFAQLLTAPHTQWEAIFETTTDTVFSTYNFDSNYALLKASLEKMQLESPNPDYIMISGDFLAHNFEDSFQLWSGIAYETQQVDSFAQLDAFISKTIHFMAGMWDKYYPNTPIYAALGNNDAFCGDYLVQPGGEFLKSFAAAFGPLTHHNGGVNTFDETFEDGGYFAQQAAHDANLRVVVLNTILFSDNFNSPWSGEAVYCTPGYFGPTNNEPGGKMLTWLDGQLTEAAAAGQKVWLMQHIPAGINVANAVPRHPIDSIPCLNGSPQMFLKDTFNTQYLKMIQKHAGVITLNIAGHYHRDDFRVYFDETKTNAISWLHVLPAISPIYDNNPGFQVATYNKTTSMLDDYTCYFVDVQQAVSSETAWAHEYKFSDIYGFTGLNTAKMHNINTQLKTDATLQQQYLTYYPVSQAASTQSDLWRVQYYVCGQTAYTWDEYKECVCGTAAN
jgi:sphingomyelin phosphodiesterase acid-like 3